MKSKENTTEVEDIINVKDFDNVNIEDVENNLSGEYKRFTRSYYAIVDFEYSISNMFKLCQLLGKVEEIIEVKIHFNSLKKVNLNNLVIVFDIGIVTRGKPVHSNEFNVLMVDKKVVSRIYDKNKTDHKGNIQRVTNEDFKIIKKKISNGENIGDNYKVLWRKKSIFSNNRSVIKPGNNVEESLMSVNNKQSLKLNIKDIFRFTTYFYSCMVSKEGEEK